MRIKEYLDSIDIEYDEEGKNVTEGWIEIACPFPGCDDPSRHLGIDLESGRFNCWVCGETGNLGKLIRTLEDITWEEANKKANSLGKTINEGDIVDAITKILQPEEVEEVRYEKIELPKEAKKVELENITHYALLWRYMQKRKISIETAEKYNLHYCKRGFYTHRLIFPIYSVFGDLVGFTSRDMTGKAKVKYLHPKGFPIKNYSYGLHLFEGRRMILVEGCIDAIRVGEGAVALFNSEMSIVQEDMIVLMHRIGMFDELVIALDSDAWAKAVLMGQELMAYIDNVRVLKLPEGEDPADLGRDKLLNYIG